MTTYEPTDWRPEPGELAEVTDEFRTEDAVFGLDKKWRSISPRTIGSLMVNPSRVRRLSRVDPASVVTLDPNKREDVDRFRKAAASYAYLSNEVVTAEAALRSLLPTPPVPEPNGLGAVVGCKYLGLLLLGHDGFWRTHDGDVVTYANADVMEVHTHGDGCTCGGPGCPEG